MQDDILPTLPTADAPALPAEAQPTPAPKPEATPKKNALDANQKHRLNLWLLEHRDDAQTLPDPPLAVSASAALGFPVTTNNLTHARENAVQIAKVTPPDPEDPISQLQAHVQDLFERVELLEDQMRAHQPQEEVAPKFYPDFRRTAD